MNIENIVLELMSRIQILEKEVEELKNYKKEEIPGDRLKKDAMCVDTIFRDNNPLVDFGDVIDFIEDQKEVKTYIYNSKEYSNKELVLAVVQNILSNKIMLNDAIDIFDDELEGIYVVIRDVELVKSCCQEKYYFIKDENIIHLKDRDVYVCSQWGQYNTEKFVKYCNESLKLKIEKI